MCALEDPMFFGFFIALGVGATKLHQFLAINFGFHTEQNHTSVVILLVLNLKLEPEYKLKIKLIHRTYVHA